MNSKALLVATAALLAMSAVSCGKDDTESSVSISLSEEQISTRERTTETASQTETTVTETVTATTSAVSGTETTIPSTELTSTVQTETVVTTTAVPAETSQTEETTQPEQSEQPTENSTPEEPTQQEETPTSEPTQSPAEEPSQSEQNEVKFNMENLLSDASGVISGLGTPDYSGQGAACTNNGNDVRIYQYDGLEIQCYIDGDKEYIFQIEITGDKYQTDKDIKVGSTRAEVESAYGAGEESGSYTIYYSGDSEMDIQYNGDAVMSIFFYTPV